MTSLCIKSNKMDSIWKMRISVMNNTCHNFDRIVNELKLEFCIIKTVIMTNRFQE